MRAVFPLGTQILHQLGSKLLLPCHSSEVNEKVKRGWYRGARWVRALALTSTRAQAKSLVLSEKPGMAVCIPVIPALRDRER